MLKKTYPLKNKLKILDIVAWWPTQQNPSLGSFIQDQVLATAAQCEHHVIFLTFTKTEWNTTPRVEIKSEMNEIGVHFLFVKSPLRRFGFHDFMVKHAYKKVLKYLSKKFSFVPDLVHVHVRSHFTKIAIDLLIEQKKPTVLSEHFSYYNRGIHLLNEKEKKREVQSIKRQLNEEVIHQIMPVSEDLSKTLKVQFEVKDKLKVIPNIANSVFLSSEHLNKAEANFVSCANWDHPKDPMTMFKALKVIEKELPYNFHLDIIGDGPLLDSMKAFVQAELASLSILFHGYQPKPFIAEKLRKAQGLLHPTTSENLPTIIIESLICGTPILSMNINGIPEMIDDRNGILVATKDTTAFGKGILQLIAANFDYESIAKNASEKYTAEVVGASIMSIYQQHIASDVNKSRSI